MADHDLIGYIKLIEEFLANNIRPLTFEQKYLEMFKKDETQWLETEYEVLNGLFGDVDAFCADDSLRDADDLNEQQLRESAGAALKTLWSLQFQRSRTEP